MYIVYQKLFANVNQQAEIFFCNIKFISQLSVMSSHGGHIHIGWRPVKPNIIFKEDYPRNISFKFG